MRGIKNDLAVTDPKAWDKSLWGLLAAQNNSGTNVNEHTALTYSAVYCAVALISGTISTLPLRLMKEKPAEGGRRKKEPAVEKTAYRVMHTQWNPFMTAQIGREVLGAHVVSWGNGYAEIVRDGMGRIVQLWPITPNRVTPFMKDGEMFYRIAVDSNQVVLPRAQVLHIPGLGFDGFVGYSVVQLARESIGLGMAMEQFGAKFFGQGAHPGLVVSHPNRLSETAFGNLSKELAVKYEGLGKAHRIMLLEENMKVEKVGMSQEDSQFLESRQFQIPEIARWFNLPPHKLKDLTKSSFSNIESEQISFVTESILPWLVRFETNFNMQLLTEQEQTHHYFKHTVEGLLRGDAKSRAEFYRTMWGIGSMSINDIREKEDLDPIPGGDEYFVPLNMVPVSMAGKNLKENGNDNQPAQPDDQDSGKKPNDPGQNKRNHLVPIR